MDVSNKQVSPTQVEVKISATYQDMKPYIDRTYANIISNLKVPGFRNGHVPRAVVNQRYGGKAAIFAESVNGAVQEFYREAMKDSKAVPLSQPTAKIGHMPESETDDPFLDVTLSIEVRPEIKLPNLKTIEVQVKAQKVEKKQIDEAIDKMRDQLGTLKVVNRTAKNGDYVLVDMKTAIDGKEVDSVSSTSYQIGEREQLQGLDEALIGMKKGDEKTFATVLAGGEYAGQEADVDLKLQAVKEKELPKLDDDFVKMASAFDTVKELEADLKKRFEEEGLRRQGAQAAELAIEKAIDSIDFPLPEGIIAEKRAGVDEYFTKNPQQTKPSDAEIDNDIARQTKRDILTSFLSDEFKVKITEDDFAAYSMQLAQMYGVEPQQIMQRMYQEGRIEQAIGELTSMKTQTVLARKVKVIDENGKTVKMDEVPTGFKDIDEPKDNVDDATPESVVVDEKAKTADDVAEHVPDVQKRKNTKKASKPTKTAVTQTRNMARVKKG
ncbi:MAG: trigger factor [Bifidobacteriaceae bacterium]|jgi:trigger factor|nr:trigger factor [Bifidobacteriaceae bacterium]